MKEKLKISLVARVSNLPYRRFPIGTPRSSAIDGGRIMSWRATQSTAGQMRTLCVQNAPKNANITFLLSLYQPLATFTP
jgi:hypothetical protein